LTGLALLIIMVPTRAAKELPMKRRWQSPREFAAELGLSPNAVYAAIKRGEVPHVKIGKRIALPPDTAERLLHQPAPPQPAAQAA
jgi:hypothetical protein